MAVSEFALISLTDAKDFLGLDDTDAQRDTWLEGEIQRQTARVEGWLDRKVKARFYREVVALQMDNSYCYTLSPKQTPILDVLNVYGDANRIFGKDSVIPLNTYQVTANRIEFTDAFEKLLGSDRLYTRRGHGEQKVHLEYAAGWGVIEVPFSRQRMDLTEDSGGETLTFYLDAGIWTPKEIVERLNIELNTAGEHARQASFNWRTRQFTITQTGGTLTLLPSKSNSGLQLLGFSGTGHTSSPATGDTVALDIPADLKGAVLNLLALDYDKGSFGKSYRGLTSVQISQYRASLANMDGSQSTSGMPKEIEAVLDKYKHWTFV